MTQPLVRVRRLWPSLATLGVMVCCGCQPEAKPIPAVDPPAMLGRKTTSEVAPAPLAEPAGNSEVLADQPGAVAEKLLPNPSDSNSHAFDAKNPTAVPTASAENRTPVREDVGEPWLPSDAPRLPIEYWEALYRNAQRIGVTQYRIEKHERNRLRLTATTYMPVTGGNKPVERLVQLESIEQPGGQMERFSESIKIGQSETKEEGSVVNGVLRLQAQSPTGKSSKQVALPSGSWGPMGIHQLLMRTPMKPKEVRVAQVFLGQTHQVARVTLIAREPESTTCPEGLLSDLIPVESFMQLEKEGIRVRMWVDQQGQVRKTIWPEGLNFSSFRIPADVGQRMVDESQVQLLAESRLAVSAQAQAVEQATKVVYHIGSSQPDPYQLFSSEATQVVKSTTAYEAELTVFKSGSENPVAPRLQHTKPESNCSQPSPYVDSQSSIVAQLAESLAADERVPSAVALRLNEGLFKTLKLHKYDVTIRSASETIQLQTGDAVDYAVTLAALLRSRGIPARVASGICLRQVESQTFFAYHMWTEAWTGEEWQALDPSTGQRTGCGYIKFLESPLEGSNPYRAMLPVLEALDKLKITLQK